MGEKISDEVCFRLGFEALFNHSPQEFVMSAIKGDLPWTLEGLKSFPVDFDLFLELVERGKEILVQPQKGGDL